MKCPNCGSLTNYERNQLSDKKYPPFFSCDCGCLWTEWQQKLIDELEYCLEEIAEIPFKHGEICAEIARNYFIEREKKREVPKV